MKQITLFLILALFFLCPEAKAQQGTLSGRITSGGKPVEFAYVGLAGNHKAASTDTSGYYRLTEIPLGNQVVRASCVGYLAVEKKCYIRNETTLSFELAPDNKLKNEVVVTGESESVQARENPLSITPISAKAIEQTQGQNIIDVLVKNTPGMYSVKTGPNISKPFIRGLGYNRVLTLYARP